MKVRKGDRVQILAGKERGATGVVARVLPSKNKVVIEGTFDDPYTGTPRPIGGVKRHTRARSATEPGGMVDKSLPIDASRVGVLAKDGKPVRIGTKVVDGKKVRIGRRAGQEVEL